MATNWNGLQKEHQKSSEDYRKRLAKINASIDETLRALDEGQKEIQTELEKMRVGN